MLDATKGSFHLMQYFEVTCADHWCVDGFVHKWTPKQSLFSLIIRLWNPYKMRRGIEIVRLLFWNTDETEYEIYQYAKEGKVAELAVLLLVAGKKIMSPFIFEKIRNFSAPHGSKTLRQYITSEIASLTGLRTRLVHETGSHAFLQTCNDKLATMTSMLMLLEVFERVGDKIMAYYIHHSADDVCADMKGIKVPTDLACLIQEAGFITDYADLHIKDRLNSKWEMVWESLRDQVNSEIEQEKSLYLRFPNSMDSIDLQLCGKKEKGKKKLWNVTVKHDGKMLKVKKSITCNELDDDIILGFPYRARYLTKAHISREFATNTRAKAKSFPVTMALVEPNFLLFKQYASVTLPILRRIRLL
ncbi:hypothetical protein O6P43_008414 [Quillaja saponaria]|uniref:Uncharacterized protein n=1 Tax=Quillaja saponaria TaxID=32244 RepID=A0AAD7M5E6_QUISA|nr:hypothetical protein O6P43_008414 [Quillaja saponaria]